MKLGPIEITRARTDEYAQQPRRQRPERGELGATGTTFFGGLLTGEEYNLDLQGDKGLRVYERMFKSDPTCRAVEKAITLPIRSAEWKVVPFKDSGKHKEVAEWVENVLFGMSNTWDWNLRHILYHLRFGRYFFEPDWEVQDGRYTVRRLAPRKPSTIARYYFEKNGELAGIQQRVWKIDPNTAGVGKIPAGQFKFIDIPASRLLWFVHDQEAGNYEGESIGRPMYKPWSLKEVVERILGIGAERREIGVEYAKMSEEATKADADAMIAVLENIHAHEQGYMLIPPTVTEQGIFGNASGRTSTMEFLNYLKREIAVSGLAEFIAMGGENGTQAMHRDKTSFFLLADKAIAEGSAAVLNRHLIRKLVLANFDGIKEDELPKLEVSRLETRNMAEYAAAVQALATAGFLTPDSVTEAAIRTEMDLPEKPEDEEPPAPGPQPPKPDGDPGEPPQPGEEDQNPDRELRLRANRRSRLWQGGFADEYAKGGQFAKGGGRVPAAGRSGVIKGEGWSANLDDEERATVEAKLATLKQDSGPHWGARDGEPAVDAEEVFGNPVGRTYGFTMTRKGLDTRYGEPTDVQLDQLRPAQKHVSVAGIRGTAERGRTVDTVPPLVVRDVTDGSLTIQEGHTRLSTLKIAGRTHANGVVVVNVAPVRSKYGIEYAPVPKGQRSVPGQLQPSIDFSVDNSVLPRWRPMTSGEEQIDLEAIETALDRAEEEIVRRAQAVQSRQIKNLADMAEKIVAANTPDRLERVDVPYTGEMAGAVASVFQDLFEVGRESMPQHMAIDPKDEDQVHGFFAARARSLAGVIASKLKAAFVWETLQQLRRGVFDRERLVGRMSELSDQELRKAASFSATEALNFGRESALPEGVKTATYSAIMDGNTCAPCQERDGAEYEVGTAEYEENRPPLYACYGGGRCRCIYVYE